MQAAGRRTMPRLAVGVRPSTSCYAPAVPRGLRRARLLYSRRAPQGGPIGLSRSRRAAQFAVVPRGLRRARLLHSRRAPQGRSFFIHYVNFFQMSTLIRLRRTAHLPGGTEGVLFFPAESGQSPMATLEPPASGAHPAIPAGEYPLRLDVVSPRFARSPRRWSAAWGARLPRLMQVPGREGILIHPGNRPADSSGCVLIGRAVSPLRLGESVATFHRLMHVLHRLPPPLRIRVED